MPDCQIVAIVSTVVEEAALENTGTVLIMMTFTAVLYGDTPEPHTRDTSLASPDTRRHSGVNGQSGQESGRQGLQLAPNYYNIRHKTSDPPLACDSSTHVDVCEDIKPCTGGGGGWC